MKAASATSADNFVPVCTVHLFEFIGGSGDAGVVADEVSGEGMSVGPRREHTQLPLLSSRTQTLAGTPSPPPHSQHASSALQGKGSPNADQSAFGLIVFGPSQ